MSTVPQVGPVVHAEFIHDPLDEGNGGLLYRPWQEPIPWNHGHTYWYGWDLLISFLALSIVTNLWSLYVAWRIRKRDGTRKLTSQTSMLFMYLNVEGLLFNVCCLIQCISNAATQMIYAEEIGCTIQAIYATLFMISYGWTLVLMAYSSDRLVRKNKRLDDRFIRNIHVFIWVVSLVEGFLLSIYPGSWRVMPSGVFCFPQLATPLGTSLFYMMGVVPCVVIMIFLYARMFLYVRAVSRAANLKRQSEGLVPLRSFTNGTDPDATSGTGSSSVYSHSTADGTGSLLLLTSGHRPAAAHVHGSAGGAGTAPSPVAGSAAASQSSYTADGSGMGYGGRPGSATNGDPSGAGASSSRWGSRFFSQRMWGVGLSSLVTGSLASFGAAMSRRYSVDDGGSSTSAGGSSTAGASAPLSGGAAGCPPPSYGRSSSSAAGSGAAGPRNGGYFLWGRKPSTVAPAPPPADTPAVSRVVVAAGRRASARRMSASSAGSGGLAQAAAAAAAAAAPEALKLKGLSRAEEEDSAEHHESSVLASVGDYKAGATNALVLLPRAADINSSRVRAAGGPMDLHLASTAEEGGEGAVPSKAVALSSGTFKAATPPSEAMSAPLLGKPTSGAAGAAGTGVLSITTVDDELARKKQRAEKAEQVAAAVYRAARTARRTSRQWQVAKRAMAFFFCYLACWWPFILITAVEWITGWAPTPNIDLVGAQTGHLNTFFNAVLHLWFNHAFRSESLGLVATMLSSVGLRRAAAYVRNATTASSNNQDNNDSGPAPAGMMQSQQQRYSSSASSGGGGGNSRASFSDYDAAGAGSSASGENTTSAATRSSASCAGSLGPTYYAPGYRSGGGTKAATAGGLKGRRAAANCVSARPLAPSGDSSMPVAGSDAEALEVPSNAAAAGEVVGGSYVYTGAGSSPISVASSTYSSSAASSSAIATTLIDGFGGGGENPSNAVAVDVLALHAVVGVASSTSDGNGLTIRRGDSSSDGVTSPTEISQPSSVGSSPRASSIVGHLSPKEDDLSLSGGASSRSQAVSVAPVRLPLTLQLAGSSGGAATARGGALASSRGGGSSASATAASSSASLRRLNNAGREGEAAIAAPAAAPLTARAIARVQEQHAATTGAVGGSGSSSGGAVAVVPLLPRPRSGGGPDWKAPSSSSSSSLLTARRQNLGTAAAGVTAGSMGPAAAPSTAQAVWILPSHAAAAAATSADEVNSRLLLGVGAGTINAGCEGVLRATTATPCTAQEQDPGQLLTSRVSCASGSSCENDANGLAPFLALSSAAAAAENSGGGASSRKNISSSAGARRSAASSGDPSSPERVSAGNSFSANINGEIDVSVLVSGAAVVQLSGRGSSSSSSSSNGGITPRESLPGTPMA